MNLTAPTTSATAIAADVRSGRRSAVDVTHEHLARIGAQLALPHLTGHRVKGMPCHRPGVHIQPDERTLVPH